MASTSAGVQGLPAYRAIEGVEPMPRILLVIDEFQEFFVEDDQVSQDAARLLDRIVRQGRAFGIHVLLGSQTLGGAYSLARATMGQMAVRITTAVAEPQPPITVSSIDDIAPASFKHSSARSELPKDDPRKRARSVRLPDRNALHGNETLPHRRTRTLPGILQVT